MNGNYFRGKKNNKTKIVSTTILIRPPRLDLPIDPNIDYQRTIHPDAYKNDPNTTRSSVVLHELMEMEQEGEFGIPYSTNPLLYNGSLLGRGAHNISLDAEYELQQKGDKRIGKQLGGGARISGEPAGISEGKEF